MCMYASAYNVGVEDLQRVERGGVAAGDGREHHEDLGGVGGEEADEEFGDVIVDATALRDCNHDRREVVVGQDDVGGLILVVCVWVG